MTEEAREYVIDFLSSEERYREVLPVAAESFVPAALAVQGVLVDLMGPGGDLVFLDLYMVAGGRMDALLSLSHKHLMSDGLPSQWSDPRYLLWRNVCCARFASLRESMASEFSPVGGLNDKSPLPEPALADAIIAEVSRAIPVGSQKWQEIVTLQRQYVVGPFFAATRGSGPHQRSKDIYLSVGPVDLNFRALLMGELASPWEILPPPYDRSVSPSLREPK